MFLPSFVRRWINGQGFASPRSRRTTTQPARRRVRLHLEALEDRSVPSTVMNLNDGGPGSLRDALASTPSGGTVDFQPGLTGTITLSTGELAIGQDLTITGPGASVLTVSGNHASRVFDIAATSTVGISGLTIADGSASNLGGGIRNAGRLTLTASALRGNSVTMATFDVQGGGLYNAASGTLTVIGCALNGNSAVGTSSVTGSGSGQGGGIYNLGTLTVTDSALSGNSASGVGQGVGQGGGLYNSGGTVSITGSTLVDNAASSNGTAGAGGADGGGILSDGTLIITASALLGNTCGGSTTSAGYGGGIYNLGTLTVSDSALTGNAVSGTLFSFGGGMFTGLLPVTVIHSALSGNTANNGYGGGLSNGGPMTVIDCTLSGNAATDYGGGIFNGGTLTVGTCTLSDNTATYGGGGIFDSYSGRLTVSASTLSGNSVSGTIAPFAYGGGIAIESGGMLTLGNTIVAGNTALVFPDVAGALSSQGHNVIGNTAGGSGFTASDLLNVDPLLGPLQDNGGQTRTRALLPGSPALNAGDPAQLGVADQRGVVRRGGVNIGAYQASASAFVLTAPAAATAGVPFDLVVTAVDAFGQRAVGYTGTVTFSTTDTNPGVVLPADYTFTTGSGGDNGQHTFSVTLSTAGSQMVTATDTVTNSITGTAPVTVTPAAASSFVVSANPTTTTAGTRTTLTVTAYDAFGNVATGYTGTVHFTSSDRQAALPADYAFTAAEGGTHTFGHVTFHRLGQQTLTVTDTLNASIFGVIDVLVRDRGQDGQGQDGH
jgi:hypothetical protein